ncbi:MAG: histidine kinase [Saprospiraceae bacterium]
MSAKNIKTIDFSAMLVRNRWMWHLCFWILYALSRAVPYYLTVMYYDVRLLYFMLWQELLFVVLVYATIWFYRRSFAVGKVSLYLSVSLTAWLLYLFFFSKSIFYVLSDLPNFKNGIWTDLFFNNITKYVFTFALVTMAKYFKDNFIQQYLESQQKQLQLTSELENLKAQIAPHFLFNTMNNFYGLAVTRSEKLPALMVRLSELLRYALYETKNPTVSLSQDVSSLTSYIELEKIRLEDNLEFTLQSNVPENCRFEIAPLLLVVFVENAFKHAKKVQNQAMRIAINMHISDDGMFVFQAENNCRPNSDNPGTSNGIGLENVKKRLEVLYPHGLHQLNIEKTASEYKVRLKINLQNPLG